MRFRDAANGDQQQQCYNRNYDFHDNPPTSQFDQNEQVLTRTNYARQTGAPATNTRHVAQPSSGPRTHFSISVCHAASRIRDLPVQYP
jgi:hypothetical protein